MNIVVRHFIEQFFRWVLDAMNRVSTTSVIQLNDQHGIAIGAKLVFLLDGRLVNIHNFFVTAKSASHHQKCGIGQMEIGNERIG